MKEKTTFGELSIGDHFVLVGVIFPKVYKKVGAETALLNKRFVEFPAPGVLVKCKKCK